MVIEIPRTLLIREPWTTMTVNGATNTRPLVVSLSDEAPQSTTLAEQINAAPSGSNTFRVVDGAGPCYEFQGYALMRNDLLTVHVEGNLKFLR